MWLALLYQLGRGLRQSRSPTISVRLWSEAAGIATARRPSYPTWIFALGNPLWKGALGDLRSFQGKQRIAGFIGQLQVSMIR